MDFKKLAIYVLLVVAALAFVLPAAAWWGGWWGGGWGGWGGLWRPWGWGLSWPWWGGGWGGLSWPGWGGWGGWMW